MKECLLFNAALPIRDLRLWREHATTRNYSQWLIEWRECENWIQDNGGVIDIDNYTIKFRDTATAVLCKLRWG